MSFFDVIAHHATLAKHAAADVVLVTPAVTSPLWLPSGTTILQVGGYVLLALRIIVALRQLGQKKPPQ